jgi:hypothetical protein
VSTRRLHKGLDKLEGRAKPGGHPEAPTGFAAEVREIDREIAALEAEEGGRVVADGRMHRG